MKILTVARLFILLFCAFHFANLEKAAGTEIPVTIIAKDITDKTIKGVRFSTLAKGAVSAATTDDGRTKLLISNDFTSGKGIEIQIHQTAEDWVFISPWDGWIKVPENGGYCKIILARPGDRRALESGDAVRAMIAGILAEVNQQATAEQSITEAQRKKVLEEQARKFGFSPQELDRAIREFGKKAKDPYDAGIAALYERNYPQAIQKLAESLLLREKKEAEAQEEVADAAYFLGQSLYKQNRYKDAAVNYGKALQRRPEDASILGSLGIVYYLLGDVPKAVEYHQKALTIDRKIGYRQDEAANLGNLGNAYSDSGDVPKAIEYHQESLMIDREIGYRQGEASDLGNLGNAYSDLGDVPKAIEYYQKALKIHREIGYRQGEASDLGNLGLAYRALGDVPKVIAHLQMALTIHREIGYRKGEASDLGNLGVAYRTLGDMPKAIEHLQMALVIFEEIQSPIADRVRQWLAELSSKE